MLTRKFSSLIRTLLVAALISSSVLSYGDDSNRKIKSKVTPTYPELAKKLGIVGLVRLDVLVASDGKVKSVVVKGGNPVLAEAAEKAIAKWRYSPGSEETIPVEVNFHPEQ